MSWSVHYASREAFTKDEREHQSGVTSNEAVEQLNAGRAVVPVLLETGALGARDGDYTIGIHGHANPDHRPATGWANDCLTINITQKAT